MTAPVPVSELEAPAPATTPRVLGALAVVLLVAAVVSAVLLQGEGRSAAETCSAPSRRAEVGLR